MSVSYGTDLKLSQFWFVYIVSPLRWAGFERGWVGHNSVSYLLIRHQSPHRPPTWFYWLPNRLLNHVTRLLEVGRFWEAISLLFRELRNTFEKIWKSVLQKPTSFFAVFIMNSVYRCLRDVWSAWEAGFIGQRSKSPRSRWLLETSKPRAQMEGALDLYAESDENFENFGTVCGFCSLISAVFHLT